MISDKLLIHTLIILKKQQQQKKLLYSLVTNILNSKNMPIHEQRKIILM